MELAGAKATVLRTVRRHRRPTHTRLLRLGFAPLLLLPLLLALLFLPAPALALHEGDDWCDNAQDGYFCNANCTGFYFCAGSTRGADVLCGRVSGESGAFTACEKHTSSMSMPIFKTYTGTGPGTTLLPSWKLACLQQPPTDDPMVTTPASCWSKTVDPCDAVTCSGHGTCTGGVCGCTLGYTGADCKTPPSGGGTDCPGKIEIMLVIDMSGSISRTQPDPDDGTGSDFDKTKRFARGLLSPFKIDDAFTRVGVVWFESRGYLRLSLSGDATQIAYYIDSELKNGGTDIGIGLTRGFDDLKANGRPGVPQLCVLITDGSGGSPQPVADQMKAAGIHITSVGFGSPDVVELEKLASYKANSTVKDFHVAPTADKLKDIFKDMAREVQSHAFGG